MSGSDQLSVGFRWQNEAGNNVNLFNVKFVMLYCMIFDIILFVSTTHTTGVVLFYNG